MATEVDQDSKEQTNEALQHNRRKEPNLHQNKSSRVLHTQKRISQWKMNHSLPNLWAFFLILTRLFKLQIEEMHVKQRKAEFKDLNEPLLQATSAILIQCKMTSLSRFSKIGVGQADAIWIVRWKAFARTSTKRSSLTLTGITDESSQ